jgi:hypothetical protein
MAHEYDQWLNGTFDDLLAFQNRCFPNELIDMHRTNELWSRSSKAGKALSLPI